MKIIYKIAKNELRFLFYSPIAWFVLIVFFTQCAVFYTDFLYSLANYQETLIKNAGEYISPGALTPMVLVKSGLFGNAITNLYFFVPLLTMGLINREVNSGSVKLLFSSPVNLRRIVVGKYIGILLYNILLVLILAVFLLTAAFNISHVDYGLLFSALLGFYLLVCAYSAIGLFMSSLSAYQIVSALSTFMIIFVLSRIDTLWQKYDFIRDLTYSLSLQNRTFKMLGGLIVSRDVCYFIAISLLFIAFTIIKLKAGREAKPWYVTTGRYALVLFIILAVGYTTSRPTFTGYLDATATKRNTIPVQMQNLIKDMGDSTLEVTMYTNLLGGGAGHGLPEARNADYLATFWEPYLRFKPGIVFKYEYYYDTDPVTTDSAIYKSFPGKSLERIAKEVTESFDGDLSDFKTPEEMHKSIDLRPENYRLVMRLKYRGRTEWLRTFDDDFFWPGMNHVSAAFKRLLIPKSPHAYFVTGNLERSIIKYGEREYSVHTASKYGRSALVNNGYDVDTLNLALQNIPADADMIEFADPKMDIPSVVSEKLKNYIDTGGNMMIFGEPGKQYVLNPFIRELGIQFMEGQLAYPTYDETPDKVICYLTPAAYDFFPDPAKTIKTLEQKKDTMKAKLIGAAAINYTPGNSFSVQPFMMTLPGKAWLKQGRMVIDSTLPPPDSAQGDIVRNSFATGLALTRTLNNKQQRIAVFSDADMASNSRIGENLSLLEGCYSWMTYKKFPVVMTRPEDKDLMLRISAPAAYIQKMIYVWILPGLLLLAAIILLIRRKRK